EHASDLVNLKRILERRENQDLVYFNRVAGRFDSVYGPGRSWQAFGQLLLRLVPEIVVADLGSGEGLLSELLARKCKRVIAVDNSEKIVKFGQAKAERNGLANLEFRQGDLQHPPIDDVSVDLAILSQALHHAEEPAQAVAGAFRILKPGGQLMILDLVAHKFGRARELFGDRWLGFAESELHQWIESAGFGRIDISVVSREEEEPHFETLLASATRPA
ncbi:MAG: class I SAM-dependent methyltransferase, partial [Verrucomicrobiota bacterium]|nr:class I SAM-dependent methyltransferase [Verrucomicrobiota bacterium]